MGINNAGGGGESQFVPPWEKYKGVADVMRQALALKREDPKRQELVQQALSRPELSWMERDIDSWVREALNSPQTFDSGMIRTMDAMSGVKPDDSSLEARIFQRWSGYPQIAAMLSNTGIGKNTMLGYIRNRIEFAQNPPPQNDLSQPINPPVLPEE